VLACLVVIMKISVRQILASGLVLLLFLVLTPAHYWQRVGNVLEGEHSIQGHVASQQVALAIFADHPVLGVGADNYNATYFPYALQLHAVDAASHVHDLYLATVAETGLCGLVAFGAALASVLRRSWQRRTQARRAFDRLGDGLATASFLALATYLVGSLFLPNAYPRYLWILVGLALTISLPVVDRSPPPQPQVLHDDARAI
jgi:O-antigen ligase